MFQIVCRMCKYTVKLTDYQIQQLLPVLNVIIIIRSRTFLLSS